MTNCSLLLPMVYQHITFDFEALCRQVILSCAQGRFRVSSCEKKEGASIKVFIFTTDNGQRLIARLPFALAGPARMTTQSEAAATINYSMSIISRVALLLIP